MGVVQKTSSEDMAHKAAKWQAAGASNFTYPSTSCIPKGWTARRRTS